MYGAVTAKDLDSSKQQCVLEAAASALAVAQDRNEVWKTRDVKMIEGFTCSEEHLGMRLFHWQL